MKIVVIIIGVLLLLIVLMYLIGRTMPVAHTVSLSKKLNAPRDTVWKMISDIDTYSNWRGVKVEKLTDTSWNEEISGDMVLMEIVEKVRGERFVTQISKQNKRMAFGGSWVFEFKSDGEGTLLTVTENGEVYNPIFKFMSKYIFGHTATMKQYLKKLEKGINTNK